MHLFWLLCKCFLTAFLRRCVFWATSSQVWDLRCSSNVLWPMCSAHIFSQYDIDFWNHLFLIQICCYWNSRSTFHLTKYIAHYSCKRANILYRKQMVTFLLNEDCEQFQFLMYGPQWIHPILCIYEPCKSPQIYLLKQMCKWGCWWPHFWKSGLLHALLLLTAREVWISWHFTPAANAEVVKI